MLPHEIATGEAAHESSIETAGRGVVEILRAGRESQLCLPKETGKSPITALGPFLIHQQAQALLEGESLRVGVLALALKPGGHAPQLHRLQFLHSGLYQHDSSLGSA